MFSCPTFEQVSFFVLLQCGSKALGRDLSFLFFRHRWGGHGVLGLKCRGDVCADHLPVLAGREDLLSVGDGHWLLKQILLCLFSM